MKKEKIKSIQILKKTIKDRAEECISKLHIEEPNKSVKCDCCNEKVNIADTFLFNGKRYCVDCGYCLVMDIADRGVINIDFSNEDTEGMIVNL